MALDLSARQRAMLQEMGVPVWLPVPQPVTVVQESARPATASARGAPSDVSTPSSVVRPPAVPVSPQQAPESAQDGPALAAQAQACQACGLCAGRTHSTLSAHRWPGDGTRLQTDWFVVGDLPDADEDRAGQPFVAQTGQLLDAMLKAVGADRSGRGRQGAYLSNVVKCHPQPGRVPQADEWAQCMHFLRQELAWVRPKVVLAMGRFAIQALLHEHPAEAALPLGKQRGMLYRFQGVPVVVTYHPKVLLRASVDKAKAWADLCLALDVVDGR